MFHLEREVPLERCRNHLVAQPLRSLKLLSHDVAQVDQADLPYGPFDVELDGVGGERTPFSNHPWS